VVFSKRGYIKRMGADTFSLQGRNGRGAAPVPCTQHHELCRLHTLLACVMHAVQGLSLFAGTKGATLKSDDSMEEVLHVMDHDSVLFFTQVKLLLCYKHVA
jgi:DNA gyrase/topoisomerase IV subunit A